MKVVVTGGSGQLGTVLLRRLLRDQTVEQVISIDLRPPALPSDKLKSVIADVRDSELAKHFAGCDALFHLAFVVTNFRPREEVDSINIEGSKNVFRAAAAAGLKQIVYSSSIAAYGVVAGHALPLTEETPRIFVPDFAYSATKFQVEAFLDDFEREHKELAIVRLRPAILVGRTMEHPLGDMLRRRTLISISTTPMPLVWDEDVADAAILALRERAHGAFNLCADELLSPSDLAREGGLRHVHLGPGTRKVLGQLEPYLRKLRRGPSQDPAWIKNADVGMTTSSARARQVLGWQPRFPTAVSIIRHFVQTVPGRLDLRLAALFRLAKNAAEKSLAESDLQGISERIHLMITGPGGGDFGIVVEHGRLRIEPRAPRPPTAILRIRDQLLIDLLAERTDLDSAQRSGKMELLGEPRAIEILGDIIARFQQSAGLPGLAGLVAGGLQMWLRRGAAPANADAQSETDRDFEEPSR